jgi:hypothetical protein
MDKKDISINNFLHLVWDCDNSDASKYFLLRNISNFFFYFLKIIFDINTLKQSKNIIFFILNKKNSKFLKTWFHLISKSPLN